jgi:hypothetical protein
MPTIGFLKSRNAAAARACAGPPVCARDKRATLVEHLESRSVVVARRSVAFDDALVLHRHFKHGTGGQLADMLAM